MIWTKILGWFGGTGLGKSVSTVAVVLATIQVMNWVSVNPKVKRLDEASEQIVQLDKTVLDYARADTLHRRQIGELQTTIKVVQDSAKTDRVRREAFYQRQLAGVQRSIAQLNNERKSDLVYISQLETGLRVDTVILRFRKALFGPDKLIDSSYVFGF